MVPSPSHVPSTVSLPAAARPDAEAAVAPIPAVAVAASRSGSSFVRISPSFGFLGGQPKLSPALPLEHGHEVAARAVLLATGAQYRRLPVDRLSDFEGQTVFYAAGPPEAQLCGGGTGSPFATAERSPSCTERTGGSRPSRSPMGNPFRSRFCSSSSAPTRARTGSTTLWRGTTTGSSSPA